MHEEHEEHPQAMDASCEYESDSDSTTTDPDMPGLMAASDSEDEDDEDLPRRVTEFDNNESDDEDMPNLQSVSDSDSDDDKRNNASFDDFSDEESSVETDSDFDDMMIFEDADEEDYKWEDYVNNRSFSATAKGDILIHVPNGSSGVSQVLLKDVLYAPSMSVTLVSISRIVESGASVLFAKTSCRIYDKDQICIGNIPVQGGLYRRHPSVNQSYRRKRRVGPIR
ncbi:hypothetical protein CVT25_012870 [Psilocybe cyanescens]|uniref:Retrovirus-related Pol polyprotein from transposon TNT 1-94-like beta-barrel domain-containing protein n=1 Tax=Psilocybe cyanescens TaxID=93625 RepID=A0A409X7J8_PSICY|nr:hypothetical protein CVT25_012870 [Psilocybe cyanescens]